MDDLVTKIIPVVQMLVPGFVVTTIFYWLSESKKPGQFERTIQALIGTALISVVVNGIEVFLAYIGSKGLSIGPWTDNIATVWAILIAMVLGFALAHAANNDTLYGLARDRGFTSRASYSEWILAFRKFPKRWLVLNLLDGRRLYGYPLVWPSDPKDGYFVMQFAAWIVVDDDGNGAYDDCPGEYVVINSVDVFLVEIFGKNI